MYRVIFLLTLVSTIVAETTFRPASSYSAKGGGILIRNIESSENQRVYEYRIEPVKVEESEKTGYSRLVLGSSAETAFPGEPAVPYISKRIVIPQGMQLDSVTYKSDKSGKSAQVLPVN